MVNTAVIYLQNLQFNLKNVVNLLTIDFYCKSDWTIVIVMLLVFDLLYLVYWNMTQGKESLALLDTPLKGFGNL